jgi:hypothetical protein
LILGAHSPRIDTSWNMKIMKRYNDN